MKQYNLMTSALIIGGIIPLLLLFRFDLYIDLFAKIDSSKANDIGSWLAGTTGAFWGLASILLILQSFDLSRKQKEEDIFFNLMNNLHNVTNTIHGEFWDTFSSVSQQKQHSGTAFFTRFLNQLNTNVYDNELFQEYLKISHKVEPPSVYPFKELEPDRIPSNSILDNEALTTITYKIWIYNSLYEQYHSQLGHFFRLVYNIIKYIDSSQQLNKVEKRKLVNLIQAQLTNDQLGVMFYNILSGYDNFYKLVNEDYPDFFQNIDRNSLIDAKDIKYYPKADFNINLRQKAITMRSVSLVKINEVVSDWLENKFLPNHQKIASSYPNTMVPDEYVIQFKCSSDLNNQILDEQYLFRTNTLSPNALSDNHNSDANQLKNKLAEFDNNFKNRLGY